MTKPRVWKLLKVSSTVYCTSTGHYFFSCVFDYHHSRPTIQYCLNGGTDKPLPKYALAAIKEHIGFEGPDKFKVYECDRDGNARYTDLRYHDPEYFVDAVKRLYPLPF